MASLQQIVPDPDALVRAVAAFAPNGDSHLHGEQHWQTVAAFGLILAQQTPGADPIVASTRAVRGESPL